MYEQFAYVAMALKFTLLGHTQRKIVFSEFVANDSKELLGQMENKVTWGVKI